MAPHTCLPLPIINSFYDSLNFLNQFILSYWFKNIIHSPVVQSRLGILKFIISTYNNNDSIWNFSVSTFMDTGGAHPNTTIKWANLLAKSGKVLTKDVVFRKDKEKEIVGLIMKHLIDEVNQRLETDTITSIEGLKENGALLDVDLYIPDNFLLLEDRISFLYNRYDIAPYSMGEFIIDVPYAEIETMLNRGE